MSASEEKVIQLKQNGLPLSLQGMSPADVYREIQPLFQKDKTANFLAEVCVSYFNATHSTVDVIIFLQKVFLNDPALTITLPEIRAALSTLEPKPTELLEGIVEPKKTNTFVNTDEINTILEPLKNEALPIWEVAKKIQENLDHADAKPEDKKLLIREVIMKLEYRGRRDIAELLQTFYNVTHADLAELFKNTTPPGVGSLPAVEQALLCAGHLQAAQYIQSHTNERIPYIIIRSVEPKTAGSVDLFVSYIIRIVDHTLKGEHRDAEKLQNDERISNQELLALLQRSEDLAHMRGEDALHKNLKKAERHFNSLYQEQLAKADISKIHQQIKAIDEAAPSAAMQYKRSVLASYITEIVKYRQTRGLDIADSNYRALQHMREAPLHFYTGDDMKQVYAKICNTPAEKLTSKDFSVIDREVKAQRKENNTHLIFLVSLIINCYSADQATLAKQLQKKYRISNAEMALVFQNSVAALALKPSPENTDRILFYNACARELNPDPVFTELAVKQVKIDLGKIQAQDETIKEKLHRSPVSSKEFKTVMQVFEGGINADLSTICSLIAYCELESEGTVRAEWATYFKTQYGITDAMMLLVSIQTGNQKLTDLYQDKCKGVAELITPLQAWLTNNKKTLEVQCGLVTAFRNEIIKLYQDPTCFPTEEQRKLLSNMGEKLTKYYDKEQELKQLIAKRPPVEDQSHFTAQNNIYRVGTELEALRNELLNLNEKLYHAGRTPGQKAGGLFLRTMTIIGGIVLLAIGVALMAAAIVSLIAAFGPAGLLGTGAAAVFLNSLIGGVGTTAVASIVAGEATAATVLPALAVVGGAAFVGTHGAASTYAAAVLPLYSSHKFFQPAQAAEKVSGLVKEKLLSPQEGKEEEGPATPKRG